MELMRGRALRIAGISGAEPARWVLGPKGSGAIVRLFGGLATNIRAGFGAVLSLAIATFPFAVFWLVAWWAGWENSFNKGYEQAFVGPLVGLSGIAVFALTMIYLPLALAHQAVERRAFALFELRRVRSAAAHAGWRYTIWGLTVLIFALPVFAARGLPVFAEGIAPQFAEMTSEEIAALRARIDLATAAYVFVAATLLRVWSAGIYARAVLRAQSGPEADLWKNTALSYTRIGSAGRPWAVSRWMHIVLLFMIWTSVAVLVFVGQFLNHEWHIWLTHPFVFLPWGG
jgi:multisubunit Na+/H+ antiporter MnhB subunit